MKLPVSIFLSILFFCFQDPLYIVIDTNILLAHLKFVSELKDYPIPGNPVIKNCINFGIQTFWVTNFLDLYKPSYMLLFTTQN